MSTTLTVTVDESKGRLSFSRNLVLGSEYDLAWEGEGTAVPTLILFNAAGEVIGQSVAGVLKLNTASLSSLFANGTATRPKCVNCYAYDDSTVMGTGIAILCYSPLSFESGAEPELATGLADSIAAHVADVANPHNVTLAQVGAAAAAHTHQIEDLSIVMPDDKVYRMRFKYVGGEPAQYFEEVT